MMKQHIRSNASSPPHGFKDSPRTRAISFEQIQSDQGQQVNSGLINGTAEYYSNAAFVLQSGQL